MAYNSGILSLIFANDSINTIPSETLHLKENFLGGISISDVNGNVFAETFSSAAGGQTVEFENGEIGHLTDNIYGGTTLDMPGIENDMVGMPSLFGQENFYRGGELVGSIEPNFMGNGFEASGSFGETLFTTSPGLFGSTQMNFSSQFMDHSSSGQSFDLNNHFNEIDTISSQISAADLGSATDVFDGLDFMDIF